MAKKQQETKAQELKSTKNAVSETEKSANLFLNTPVWKALLKMSLPSMVLMLVFGSYFFFDSVLATNFASYDNPIIDGSAKRMFMSAFSPVNALVIAFSLLFAVGTSTRVAINLGAGRRSRAVNTLKTGSMFMMATSLILIPILLFSAKPWMESQYTSMLHSGDPQKIAFAHMIVNEGYKYAWPIIALIPFTMFNQFLSSMLRTEARNKQMMIALILPVFLNLTLDYLLMGVAHMGVEGGAWATVIATAITTGILFFFIWRTKASIITFKHLFTLRFKILSIIGIALVGMSPFLRNLSQAVNGSTQTQIFLNASQASYGNPQAGLIMFSGIIPIFTLFFPVMFAFVQAATPIASYNYGAKNYRRVKQTYLYTLLFAIIAAALIYFVVAWGLARPLAELLQVKTVDINSIGPLAGTFNGPFIPMDEVLLATKYIMLSVIGFVPAIAAMVIFSSTDRIGVNAIASSMQGLILFWPVFFGMGALQEHIGTTFKYVIWFGWPIVNMFTTIVLTPTALITLHNLPRKQQMTLDERIDIVNKWLTSKKFRNEWKEGAANRKKDRKAANAKLKITANKADRDLKAKRKATRATK